MTNDTTKTCTRCKNNYPATPEYFHRESRKLDGLNCVCKQCHKRAYADNPRPKIEAQKRYRDENKEAISTRRKERYDKNENSARCRAYRIKNKEILREKKKQSYIENREVYKQKRKDYVARNREKVLECLRRDYLKNRELRLKQKQEYGRRNRAILREKSKKYRHLWKLSRARRRATLRRLPNDFTSTDWRICLEYFNHRCCICGNTIGLWHTLAPDHWIPISSPECPGNVKSNIVPMCHAIKDGSGGCNNNKSSKDPESWLVERYGKRKARQILDRIHAYFEWVKQQ